jgi:hypothetical protein
LLHYINYPHNCFGNTKSPLPWILFYPFEEAIYSIESMSRYGFDIFSVSFLNNWALTYDLPMPYHILFRSATLMSSMFRCYLLVAKV